MWYKNTYFQVFVLLVLSGLPILASLDRLAIQLWDESRLAINAFEMYQSGYSLVTTYNFEPETWNTKPPLLIWLQVLSFKLFGVNEVAFRLPSALAAIGTCFIIFFFCKKILKMPLAGVMASLILITSMGYMKYHHSARTGDYDALLTFFTTTYILSYFAFLETEKRRFLTFTFLALIGAALTKGIAGMLIAPGLLIYTLYKKKILYVLKKPNLYIGLFSFIGIVAAYYLLRNYYQPEYLQLINENELSGRYVEVGVNTNESILNPYHYYDLLVESNFKNWFPFIAPSIFLGFIVKDRLINSITFYLTATSLLFFIVISNATSKTDWYDMPAYPLLSIILGVAICYFLNLLLKYSNVVNFNKKVTATILLFILLFGLPYNSTIQYITTTYPGDWIAENTSVTHFLKDVLHKKNYTKYKNYTIVKNKEYEVNVNWYASVLNTKGYGIDIIEIKGDIPIPNVQTGDTILAYHDGVKKFIEYYYDVDYLEIKDNAVMYKVNGVPEKI